MKTWNELKEALARHGVELVVHGPSSEPYRNREGQFAVASSLDLIIDGQTVELCPTVFETIGLYPQGE